MAIFVCNSMDQSSFNFTQRAPKKGQYTGALQSFRVTQNFESPDANFLVLANSNLNWSLHHVSDTVMTTSKISVFYAVFTHSQLVQCPRMGRPDMKCSMIKFICHNDSIQYIRKDIKWKKWRKKIYINVRENTKQNDVNGVGFLQYYRNNVWNLVLTNNSPW